MPRPLSGTIRLTTETCPITQGTAPNLLAQSRYKLISDQKAKRGREGSDELFRDDDINTLRMFS